MIIEGSITKEGSLERCAEITSYFQNNVAGSLGTAVFRSGSNVTVVDKNFYAISLNKLLHEINDSIFYEKTYVAWNYVVFLPEKALNKQVDYLSKSVTDFISDLPPSLPGNLRSGLEDKLMNYVYSVKRGLRTQTDDEFFKNKVVVNTSPIGRGAPFRPVNYQAAKNLFTYERVQNE